MGAETKKCPYCAEDIKSEAVKCRYCGSMLDGGAAPKVQRAVLPAQPVSRVQVKVEPQHGFFMRSIKSAIALMTFVILASVIGTCVMCGKAAHDVVQNSAEQDQTDRASVAADKPIDITAARLEAAYAANEVAADNQYKNHVLRVSGAVDRISKDILDDPHVLLQSDRVLGGVMCSFGKAGTQGIANLRPGQHVVLRGIGDGFSVGSPALRACVVDTDSPTSDAEAHDANEKRKADGTSSTPRARIHRRHSGSANPAGQASAAQADVAADKAWLEGDAGSSAPLLTSADRQPEWQGEALTPPPQSGTRDSHSRPLSDTEIETAVSTQSGPLQGCVTAAASGTDLIGMITVRMLVDGSGAAIKSKVEAPKYLFDHGLLKCVREAVHQLRFPATGAPTLVTIPITLTAN